jgi:uncharacterized membrane protein YfcA
MSAINIIILLAAGVVAGFTGGLIGLGGAFLMTPVQFFVYTRMGLPEDAAIMTAFGTSLLVVLTTAISGAWQHHRKGAVMWRVAVIMGGSGLLFSYAGSTIATHVPGAVLKIIFGSIAILACFRMLIATRESADSEQVTNPWLWIAWAVPVGLLAGLLGVGGGVIMIPVLVLALKFKIHNAVANSLAIMIFSSLGGIVGYIVNGAGVPDRLPYSLGYVNLPSWLLLAAPSAVMAQVGAVVAHRINRKVLMYIFIVIMLYIGLRMMGVFEWLGWPI